MHKALNAFVEGKLSGWPDIPLDEMSFQPTMENVEWLFWLEEKGHCTGSHTRKQLSLDKGMTMFLQEREGKTGNIVLEVRTCASHICFSCIHIFQKYLQK